MPIANAPPPISRLGPYLLGRRLGRGGMGDVFEATHIMMTGRRVAIKLIKPDLAKQPQLVQRFLREIEAIGGVKAHANIVRAEFADIAENIPYLVMEYVEGIDLGQLVKDQGPLSVADACNCVYQATRGLEAIHDAHLVHRDLKPGNLMLATDGVVKILDLGLARLQSVDNAAGELTSANSILGTMDFSAPEQTADPRTVDIRADIYSLGCTLFKLLTDRTPFADYATVAQKIHAHANVPFPALPDGMPMELNAVVQKMTAKNRADRFATPTALVEALRPFAEGSQLKATPPEAFTRHGDDETPGTAARETLTYSPAEPASEPKPAQKWPRRRKLMVAAGLLLVGIAVSLATLWRFREPVDPYDVDHLEPMRWHPLFVREPMKLVWTQTDGPGHTKYDERMQRFFITNRDMAYFKIGTTKKRNYKFQVTLDTNTWERVGVFFGYRTPIDDPTLKDDEIARFQYVSFNLIGEKPDLSLDRGRETLSRNADARIVPKSEWLKSEEIPKRLGERVLEISVTERDAVQIYLDNVRLSSLAELDPGDIIPGEDFRGSFGILAHRNDCHFRDAKIYLFARGE